MLTEQELKALLAELQEKHPLKDTTPIKLLFGGWGSASADLNDRSIVIPRSWLKDEPWCYYTLIHEFGHFLSRDNDSNLEKAARSLHSYLGHDRLFRRTEDFLMAEHGIQLKRWVVYPRLLETPWGRADLTEQTLQDAILTALSLNGFVWLCLAMAFEDTSLGAPWAVIYFAVALLFTGPINYWLGGFHQSYVRWRYRKHGIRRRA